MSVNTPFRHLPGEGTHTPSRPRGRETRTDFTDRMFSGLVSFARQGTVCILLFSLYITDVNSCYCLLLHADFVIAAQSKNTDAMASCSLIFQRSISSVVQS